MVILIAPHFVESIAVGSIGESGTFVLNGQLQHLTHPEMNLLPLLDSQQIAAAGRMDAAQVQDFRGVEIADPRQRPLIEKRHFDGPLAQSHPLLHFRCGDIQSIRTNPSSRKLLSKLIDRKQPHASQPPPVPVPNRLERPLFQIQPKPQMLLRRRIRHQHQPRHPRLKDQRILALQIHHHPLPHAADARNLLPDYSLAQRRPSRLHRNRPLLARHPHRSRNPAPYRFQDSAAHGFDFR